MLSLDTVNIIASYLNTKDFRSLRNTCKSFRELEYNPKRYMKTGIVKKNKLYLKMNRWMFMLMLTSLTIFIFTLSMMSLVLLIGNKYNIESQYILGGSLIIIVIVILLVEIAFIITTVGIRTDIIDKIELV